MVIRYFPPRANDTILVILMKTQKRVYHGHQILSFINLMVIIQVPILQQQMALDTVYAQVFLTKVTLDGLL